MRVRNQKLIHWSGKHTKKTKFTKKFFERASLKSGIPEMCHHNSRNPEMGQLKSGIPEMCYHKLRIPEMCQLKSGNTFQEFLNWAGSFQEFSICGSSIQEFLNWAGPFREFLIWGGTFQEFLIWGWPFYENFLENCVFLACFWLQWISFWLPTLIYSDDMYILQKKNGQKRSILCEIRTQSFYYPLYGVATAYPTNENPSTDKLSRAIN